MKIMQIHNEYKYFGGEDTVLENEKIVLVKNGHEVTQIIRNNNNEIKNIWDQLIISRNLIHSKKSEKIIK